MRRDGHRFQRIAEQVDQHLLNLDPVGKHQIARRVQVEAQEHALFAGAGEPERAGLFDHFRKTLDALLGRVARDEVAQSPDDVAGADRLLGGAIERRFDLRRVGVGAASQQAARSLHVVADGRQRLIEFVGEGGSHLAHRAQTRDVDQFGLQFLQPCLGLLLLGEIADEARKEGLSSRMHLADGEMHRKRRAVLAHAGDDAADADDAPFTRLQVAGEVAVMAAAIRLRHQLADVFSDRLGFGVAELTLGGAGEELHDAVLVDHDHRIRDRIQDRAKVPLAES